MIWLVRNLFHLGPPSALVVATEHRHKATIDRADRLLRLLEQYRLADAKRRHQ